MVSTYGEQKLFSCLDGSGIWHSCFFEGTVLTSVNMYSVVVGCCSLRRIESQILILPKTAGAGAPLVSLKFGSTLFAFTLISD